MMKISQVENGWRAVAEGADGCRSVRFEGALNLRRFRAKRFSDRAVLYRLLVPPPHPRTNEF